MYIVYLHKNCSSILLKQFNYIKIKYYSLVYSNKFCLVHKNLIIGGKQKSGALAQKRKIQ